MKQEDKDLQLQYLSASLPYGVECLAGDVVVGKLVGIVPYAGEIYLYLRGVLTPYRLDEVKPYLRSMDDMTEEEKREMHKLLSPEGTAIYKNDGIASPINHCGEFVPYEFMNRIIQYLLEHHLDFMGLIPKGLAITVTEGYNPYET